jgi:prevent-host-death family protein
MMKSTVVTATEFKAKCLAYLNEIEQGSRITVTRRGRPVAVVSPPQRRGWKSPGNSWARKGRIVGNIIDPDTNLWEAARED